MKLIDSEKLIGDFLGCTPESEIGLHEAVDLIDKAPAVDASPIVHARWEEYTPDTLRYFTVCSKCGHEAFMHPRYGYKPTPYCPYCGAKMDEVAE